MTQPSGASDERPSLLILSFSNLVADARLLKQIRAFHGEYRVTTCGFGPAPLADATHIELPAATSTLFRRLEGLSLRARTHRLTYELSPWVRRAKRALAGREFDAVLANDLDTIGVALSIAPPERVHLDLHEFWTGIHDDVPSWVQLRVPYHQWLLRTWARSAASATTINRPLAERYAQEYGIRCDVVTNAGEYRALQPSETKTPLRLVHSGGAQPNRRIERMMHAVARSRSDAILDLYLVGEGTSYHRELCTLADALGDRIRVLPPVPHADLVDVLNTYDVGLPFLPPTTTNIRMTLPNKFFDYVQARLAIITGPTPPMTELVMAHDLGVITTGFETEDLTAALDSIEAEQVAQWKRHAHEAAEELSAQPQNSVWTQAIARIVHRATSA